MIDKMVRWLYKIPSKNEILRIKKANESMIIEQIGIEKYNKIKRAYERREELEYECMRDFMEKNECSLFLLAMSR